MFYSMKMKVQIFIANFGWSNYVKYINGWISKFALFVPLIGYVILFNDTIAKQLIFNHLAVEQSFEGLDTYTRLKLIYFGLIFLGISNFIYLWRKPYIFRFGTSVEEYTKKALEVFTLDDFIQLHQNIQSNVYGPSTKNGKYLTSEYDSFINESVYDEEKFLDWEVSKNKYGNLLRNILRETFFNLNKVNIKSLILSLILTTIGYICLIIPSIDLFIKVVTSAFIK